MSATARKIAGGTAPERLSIPAAPVLWTLHERSDRSKARVGPSGAPRASRCPTLAGRVLNGAPKSSRRKAPAGPAPRLGMAPSTRGRRAGGARGVRLGAILGLLTLSLVACGRSADTRAPRLRERAQPYLRSFESFDGWARRSFDADLALRDPSALSETLFAPIRRDREVVSAWVERDGPDARALRLRSDAAIDEAWTEGWVGLRGVPMLNNLEAATGTFPDRRRRRAPDANVLLLSRRVPSARGGAPVRVVVAYDLATE